MATSATLFINCLATLSVILFDLTTNSAGFIGATAKPVVGSMPVSNSIVKPGLLLIRSARLLLEIANSGAVGFVSLISLNFFSKSVNLL